MVQSDTVEAVFDNDAGQGFLVADGCVGPLLPNADVTTELVLRLSYPQLT